MPNEFLTTAVCGRFPASVALLGLAALAGCGDPFAAPLGTYRFDPPAPYSAAWAAVEECSGIRGDMGRVRWYAVPDVWSFPCADGEECSGLWRSPHAILLTEFAQASHGDNYFVVRHEMLHDLVGGGQEHPPVFEQCGLMRRW